MVDPVADRSDLEEIFNSPAARRLDALYAYQASPEGKRAMECMDRIRSAMISAFERHLIVQRVYLRPDIAESLAKCWNLKGEDPPKKLVAMFNPAGETVPVSIVDGLVEEFVLSIEFGFRAEVPHG